MPENSACPSQVGLIGAFESPVARMTLLAWNVPSELSTIHVLSLRIVVARTPNLTSMSFEEL